jgi:hypothetical protein
MTYLIQAPPYVFAYIATLAVSWSAGKYQEHCYHIIGSAVMCMIGTAIVISTLNPGARYFGMFFMCAGPFIGLNVREISSTLPSAHADHNSDPYSLGNNKRLHTQSKARCSRSYHQLHRFCLTLVHSLPIRKQKIHIFFLLI